MELKKLMEHISIIPDYRQAWKVEHKLSDILLLTICAVISGAEGWEDIEDFGETHLDFLKQYGDFENGIPVHDTIARVVSCISPAKFHECFINWMRDCHTSDDKDVIAIDGKTLRHSYDKSRRKGAIHVISALSFPCARLLLVETSSYVDFSATRAFYTKQGFINEAIIRNYYDVGEDKLIFTKNIQS